MENIGERIKILRINQGKTQKQLSDAAGITRQATIAEIEAGKRVPTADILVNIADVLNTTVHYLVTGVQPENATIYKKLGLSDETITTLKTLCENEPVKSARISALIHALLSDINLCLDLADYLYLEYDAFCGMMKEDKGFLLSLFGADRLHEMTLFSNLEPIARLKIIDEIKALRESIQTEVCNNGKHRKEK